jgi:hypothetical protein
MASLPAKSQSLAEADLSSCLFAVVPGPHEVVPCCEIRPMLEGLPIPPRECIEAAQWRLLESAQRKLKSLMAEKRTVQRVLGTERNLLVVGGRSKKHLGRPMTESTCLYSPHPAHWHDSTCWRAIAKTTTGRTAW